MFSLRDRALRSCAKARLVALLATFCTAGLAAAAERDAPVSLSEAITRAVAAAPSLAAAEERAAGALHGVDQALRSPNPTLGLEVENFSGSGPYRGLRGSDATLYYEQQIERGGKRAARGALAQAEADMARARGGLARLDLIEEISTVWVEAAIARARVEIAAARLESARRLAGEAKRRGDAGAGAPQDLAGAQAERAEAEALLAVARADAEARGAALASYWRQPFAVADARGLSDLGAARRAGRTLARGDLALMRSEKDAASGRLKVEESLGYADPSFQVGVRHFSENDDVALMIGGSIPLQLNDDNGAAVARARRERTASEHDMAAAEAALTREIAHKEAALAAYAEALRSLDAEALPALERAHRAATNAFVAGSSSYADLANARRALTDAQERRLETLRQFHLTAVRLDRLSGRHEDAGQEARP